MKQLNKKEIKKAFKHIKRSRSIALILENIQYARNVAGIFRTADAAGVAKIFLTGISHKPPFGKDLVKASRHKEKVVSWEYNKSTGKVVDKLKRDGYKIVAIEITDKSFPHYALIDNFRNEKKLAFIAGSEVYGITKKTLARCDASVHIPMIGKGRSLNVTTSVGIILFSLN
ncbi:MAG: TrmH family RNA methyltransferase [Candidatus Dojkabacteria bacterium]|nr:TrmH family RNA methyltransferase [Candidatus Dojkabacteria bacterium]